MAIYQKDSCILHKIGLLSSNNGHSIPSRIKPIQGLASAGFFVA